MPVSNPFNPLQLEEIREFEPTLGMVLGSGFGSLVDRLELAGECAFADVGGIPGSTVPGHAGKFVWGELAGQRVLIAQGRIHLYEGHGARAVAVPVRFIHAVGVEKILLTNAAGALNGSFAPGDLMILNDHLNLTGVSPLDGADGFISMMNAYDEGWREELLLVAEKKGVGAVIHEGVYAGLRGPQYETPAEIGMLRVLGADAVGMSTVLETIQARALGMKVSGVSCLTNWAAGMPGASFSHDDVVEVANRACDTLYQLLV